MTTPTTTPAATGAAVRERHILRVHFHLPHEDPDLYEELIELLSTLTPLVQPLPPLAADLDISGSLRLFDCDGETLARLLQIRVMALHGIETSIGLGPNRMLASMAADATEPGELTHVPATPDAIARFLRPRRTAALPGIGPKTARTLTTHGLHHIGALADTPLLTLQRLLGTAAGRHLHERAHGVDQRPVEPGELAKSLSARHDFPRDELEPAAQQRALLALAEELGLRLRTSHQITGTLTVTVRYADRSTTSRTRTLTEPTQHSKALAAAAYDLHTQLGLQRARVRALTLRAERLAPAAAASHQLTFDPVDDRARTVETVADRLRARFGPTALMPASLAVPDRTRSPRERAAAHRRHPGGANPERKPAALRAPAPTQHTGPDTGPAQHQEPQP
ncbi:DNA polymerase thumb domain-containing protein [Streptomyces sp. NPDC051561]|uniref:DNA polymerase Y family protein n=1 Tax=Streptomyces sp. NPDC051561 TaxID=3365658 RepID=UPI0037A04A37